MYSEQFRQVDCTILYSGSIFAGVGSTIDTTSYGSVVVQLIGQGLIESTIEGSNDNTNWNTVVLNQIGDIGSPVDSMTMPTGYQFKTSYQYIRYNVAYMNGTFTMTIIGRSGPGPSAIDSLAAAFNKDTPLNVETGLKKDQSGALMLSDVLYSMTVPPLASGVTSTTITIDCLGYASWSIVSAGSTLNIGGLQVSNDGVNWAALTTYYSTGLVDAQAITSGSFSSTSSPFIEYGSVFFRYLRISITGTLVTSSTPRPQTTILLKTMNGSPVVQSDILINGVRPTPASALTGAGSGVLAVGGAVTSGQTGTFTYPVLVGGVIDGLSITSNNTFGVARYVSLDGYGRTNLGVNSPYFPGTSNTTIQPTAVSPQSNSSRPLNVLGSIPATVQGSAALNVQETSQFEGQSILELLAQILVDLRIANQQVYELPRLIANNQQYLDSPESFRQEQSAFNQ